MVYFQQIEVMFGQEKITTSVIKYRCLTTHRRFMQSITTATPNL